MGLDFVCVLGLNLSVSSSVRSIVVMLDFSSGWQVQPGGRSEVRGDRARDGDRLSENLRHKGLKLKQTHSHTSTLQEHLTASGKLGIFSNILMLGRFFFPLTFFMTKKQLGYVSCLVLFCFIFCQQIFLCCGGGSLRTADCKLQGPKLLRQPLSCPEFAVDS